MTELLQKMMDELTKLPEEEQDAIASRVLSELEDDSQWDSAFSSSQDQLARLAQKARDAIRRGDAQEGGWDEL